MPSNPYRTPQAAETRRPATEGASKYAACPNCRTHSAEQVKWTMWGGYLGPKMFSHVKCLNCNTKYNGKTGRSNSTAIAIYLGVSLLLSIVILGVIFYMLWAVPPQLQPIK